MTFTDAAAEVLRLVGRPLHYKEITDLAIEKNLLSHVGKSPEVTMGARLASLVKKDTPDTQLVRVKPGVFALREWDDATIKAGLEIKGPAVIPESSLAGNAAPAPVLDEDDEILIGGDDEATPTLDDDDDDESRATLIPKAAHHTAMVQPLVVPAPRPSHAFDEDDVIDGPEAAKRAELVAAAADVFDEEDDDDQPILGGDPGADGAAAGEGQDGRRRRRRRRRGRGGPEAPGSGGGGGLPSYTAVPVDDRAVVPQEARSHEPRAHEGRQHDVGGRDNNRRDGRQGRDRDNRDNRDGGREAPLPQVPDFLGTEGPQFDDLSGGEFAEAVHSVLSTFDRGGGPVSLRQIAETVQRKGRLAGDVQTTQSQVAAAVRADNQRRIQTGQRPRFRFAGGRVGLTDWFLGGDLAALEAEALAAVERYRDAARRSFARKIGELPGHAFVELVVLALEKIGVRDLRALRRPGTPGGETHFSALLRTPLEDLRTAIVIRRDGREVGRERITELRGALHHYQSARAGFVFTSGQVLSGAREEAAATGVAPVSLYDGAGVARLCEENDVAVLRARLPIAIPDVDLLEALRAS